MPESKLVPPFDILEHSTTPNNEVNSILIAIRNPHSQHILEGEKKAEFRRTNLSQERKLRYGLIYEPSPTKAIIGGFEITGVSRLPIQDLWKIAKEKTPSNKDSFFEYFSGKNVGTAIHVGDVFKFNRHICYKNKKGEPLYNPPQDFRYLDLHEFLNQMRDAH